MIFLILLCVICWPHNQKGYTMGHIRNIFAGILVIALLFYAAWMTKAFIAMDISITPIHPSALSSAPQSKPSVYLVTYADGPEVFLKNQNMLTFTALNKGIDFFLQYRNNIFLRSSLPHIKRS